MTTRRNRLLTPLIGGGICLAVLAVIEARIGYFLDDWLHLALSRAMPHPLDPFFHDRMLGAFFRPLGIAWWWLLAHLGDPGPGMRHLAALLLHALAAVSVGLAAGIWRKDRDTGWAAGLLWLTSPIALAAVGWLSCGYDLLAALFIAMTLWRGMIYVRNGHRGNLPVLFVCALAACWSKESAYALPLIVLPLLLSAVSVDRRRAAIAVGVSALAVAAALCHRYAILGQWLGGYREPRPVQWWKGLPQFLAAIQEQTPWWLIRLALLAFCLGAFFYLAKESRKPLAAGLAATAAAFLPTMVLLRTPSMLSVLPARYLSSVALISSFPLTCLFAFLSKKSRGAAVVLLALFMASGTVIGWQSGHVMKQRTASEKAQVDAVLDRVRNDFTAGHTIFCETGCKVVGIDAAIKTLEPEMLGKVIVLNCDFPTHVVVTNSQGKLLRRFWSSRLPANPSSGFGLVWGEARSDYKHCKRLAGKGK